MCLNNVFVVNKVWQPIVPQAVIYVRLRSSTTSDGH